LWKEGQKENEDRTNATIQQRIERVRDRVKPEGITNKEWQREKQGNKLRAKEQGVRTEVQRDRDDKFKEENSPNWVMRDTLDNITCMCEVDELRAGGCCKTCKVLRKVHEYMLDKFKDAAEGRSTII
jgi:hydroxylamine reductase (hybrid-cluster protein)